MFTDVCSVCTIRITIKLSFALSKLIPACDQALDPCTCYPPDCGSISQTKLSHALYIRVHDYERWLTLKGYSWKLCWLRIENRFDLWKRNKTDGKKRTAGRSGWSLFFSSTLFEDTNQPLLW